MNNIKQPAVSIIIPTYNVESYIEQCMDSVINQTLENIEIICIDDGSTDKSGKILDWYAHKDKRIKVIHKENSGYGQSVNLGIDLAEGTYIGIVEPDDYIKPNMYKALYEAAEKNSVDFVKADFFTVFGNWLTYSPLTNENSLYNKIIVPENHLEIFKFLMYNWCGIYKSDFLKSHNIRHNTTPGASYQDFGVYIQIFTQAKSCYFLNEPYYCYRMDNINSSFRNKSKMDIAVKECKFIEKFLDNNPQVKEKFLLAYLYRKYEFFNFTYYRLDKNLKKEFLQIFKEEFETPFLQNEINGKYFGESNYMNIKQIVTDPDKFYRKTMNVNTFLENIVSFKNYNNHKVITLLGMKLRLRRNR